MTTEEKLFNEISKKIFSWQADREEILELIRKFKSEWCKEQREFCADYVDDPVLYNSILNAPEPE